MDASDRRNEAAQKWRRLRSAIERGHLEGEVYGLPVLGPLIGAIRGYVRETRAMFREDLSS